MTALAVRTTTCPPWCVASHRNDQDIHLSVETVVRSIDGPDQYVQAVYNSTLDRHTIIVDGSEFTQDGACELLSAIRQAMDLPLRAAVAR